MGTVIAGNYYQFGGLTAKLFFGGTSCGNSGDATWCTATGATGDSAIVQGCFRLLLLCMF